MHKHTRDEAIACAMALLDRPDASAGELTAARWALRPYEADTYIAHLLRCLADARQHAMARKPPPRKDPPHWRGPDSPGPGSPLPVERAA